MSEMLTNYQASLMTKYQAILQNKWFWLVFALVIVVSFVAYGFYCTSRGYSFTGSIKIHWPKFWEMGIGCKAK